MGVQTAERRRRAKEQYESSKEMFETLAEEGDASMLMFQGPPWHFGSNYSNAGFVSWYLIRLEPFTTFSVFLQDGKFDRSDRHFHSVAQCYHSCTSTASDVKELTPEWFYMPDFLRNINGLDLGRKQNGEAVGDVILPPWAWCEPVFVCFCAACVCVLVCDRSVPERYYSMRARHMLWVLPARHRCDVCVCVCVCVYVAMQQLAGDVCAHQPRCAGVQHCVRAAVPVDRPRLWVSALPSSRVTLHARR
jgi:hypothetical protein